MTKKLDGLRLRNGLLNHSVEVDKGRAWVRDEIRRAGVYVQPTEAQRILSRRPDLSEYGYQMSVASRQWLELIYEISSYTIRPLLAVSSIGEQGVAVQP
jgi:hypothetical protein